MPPFSRLSLPAPAAFRKRVDQLGLLVAGDEGLPYWETAAAYQIGAQPAAGLLKAAETLQALCRRAVATIIDTQDFSPFSIESAAMQDAITASWKAGDASLYGRMDFSFAADGTPKLLDYEADGPLALPEASYLQWEWFEALPAAQRQGASQENLLYENLLAQWPRLKLLPRAAIACGGATTADGLPADTAERFTAEYLAENAREAGASLDLASIEAVGWDGDARAFTDAQDQPLATLLKLYPWHWMEQEPNVETLGVNRTRLLPAAWTRLLADKAFLAVLWTMFPDCPFLLPASLDPADIAGDRVAKPCRGGDGEGVSLPNQSHENGAALLFQQHCPLPVFPGEDGCQAHAALSVWMVGDTASGLGFRESSGPVTDAGHRFVPHILRPA
ncbi:glutathionylspermidine synthase family protein [Roseomonas sp. 18066]|uniref:glutathionylspermidine synthase family protein n=1 Tax=Roseomonas sp. 18066 TaxID=2681412 RepID=UPI00135C360D|nr:glutathionylspermidine synthase family protein [Roseomonas sp. 18066]